MNYYDLKEEAVGKAKEALRSGDWREGAYNLLAAAKHCLRLAETAEGKTRQTWIDLSDSYTEQARRALAKVVEAKRAKKADKGREKKAEVIQQPATEDGTDPNAPWLLAQSERPKVTLANVAGLDDAKEKIRREVLDRLRYPDVYERYGIKGNTGVLLYGPPGVGKTFFAQAIAGELDWPFFQVRADEVVSKWVGDTERNIAALFKAAKSYPHAVVFIDEVSAFLSKRRGDSKWRDGMVDAFLAQIGSMEPKESIILLICTTNLPWEIDLAAVRPGRLETPIFVSLPEAEARTKILQFHTKGAPGADELDYVHLAGLMEGYSGADIASICKEAKLIAADREKSGEASKLLPSDFEQAVVKVSRSVRKEDLKKYTDFAAKVQQAAGIS